MIDIGNIERMIGNSQVNNIDLLYNGDCRELVSIIDDNKIDLVITSPPI